MYCFSQICRLCLESTKYKFINLNNNDTDNIKIFEKLTLCIPEIISPYTLPNTICNDCYNFVRRMHEFKQMCIDNTITLNKHASKLSNELAELHNLSVEINNVNSCEILCHNQCTTPIKSPEISSVSSVVEYQHLASSETLPEKASVLSNTPTAKSSVSEAEASLSSQETTVTVKPESLASPLSDSSLARPTYNLNTTTNTPEIQSTSAPFEGISMYSISLNQWDLFETKYKCKCIKEYSSFTENTEHLCENCEGELLGFRLSKIKVGVAENRYNINRAKNEQDNEDSDVSSFMGKNDSTDMENIDSDKYEHGFDYNDVLLCKVHINGVKKQINNLENNTIDEYNSPIANYINDSFEFDQSVLNSSTSSCNSSFDGNSSPQKSKSSDTGKRHICTVCNKSFSRKYYLNNHFLTHSGYKLHECLKCSRRYINKEEFDRHQLAHVKIKGKDEVNLNSTPRRSIQFLSGEKPSSLKNKIDKKLQFPSEINSDDEKPVSKKSRNKPDLNSSEESLVCGTCDKIFTTKSKLAIHLMTHVGNKDYKCTICNKEFFRKENLDEHSQKFHTTARTAGKKYKCPSCDKAYNQLTNVRRHMREQHTATTDNLVAPHKKSKTKNNTKIKKKTLKRDYNQKKFKCPSCDKRYNQLSNVRRHMREHHQAKNRIPNKTLGRSSDRSSDKASDKSYERTYLSSYLCSICNKQFIQKHILEKHIFEEHTKSESKKKTLQDDVNETNYSCPICLKNFSHLSNLRMHALSHSEPQDATSNYCELCKTSYSKNTSMRKHMLTHSREKLYDCRVCFKKYDNRWVMHQHLRKAHPGEERHFKCRECPKKYTSNSALQKHFRLHMK